MTETAKEGKVETCVKCKKNAGNPYSFYFGKKVKEYTRFKNIQSKNMIEEQIKQYKIEGNLALAFCDKCIRKERWTKFGLASIWFVLFPAIALLSVIVVRAIKSESLLLEILGIIALILLFFGFLFWVNTTTNMIKALVDKKKSIGEDLAVEIGKKDLTKKDREFWTETEYLKNKLKNIRGL